ncbi:Non-histone chromosomal protein 6 [Psilocybe cubensis]|uniref:Non-histone chromosomal protein 6 n=1 Tax=Psilocybe cubensis TaxID=181762 RepID=A0ACB8H5L9_PSICU|nr:Non-histone chromosomal protein 6 [Psilocybe cubensis]KAH9483015.1 Non-histone chromosomal protein 6 [Psilocybe cubensis]
MSALANFERSRTEAPSLHAVADSLRSCAHIAEHFAKQLADAEYSPELADFINDESAKGKRRAQLSPEEDGVKKRKRNSKPKDPNAPKRPPSSYILFQNEVRKELKEQHPNLSNQDLLTLIADQWKNMSEEQKAASRVAYNKAMQTAKDQYTEEKKAYDNRTPQEIEAANAAAAAAASLKKAKPRGPKPAAPPAPAVKARSPPAAHQMPPSSPDTSSEEESDEDESTAPILQRPPDSDSSDDESEPEPVHKKRRAASPQAKAATKVKKEKGMTV